MFIIFKHKKRNVGVIMKNLKEIRKNINEVDKQMAKLFEERMELAKLVALYKKENALAIEDKVREKEVLANNVNYIENQDVKEYYVNFMQDVMDISKQYQSRIMKGMKIAYCGVEGAFSHIATKKLFASQVLLPFSNFTEAYRAVEKGYCDACVLPIENSHAGDVGSVMDLIFSGSLYINNIVDVDIVHNLIAKKGVKLSQIKKVASHPQAIAQCQKFLQKYNFEIVECSNTAIAAMDLANSNDETCAVIASEDVVNLYDLEIIESNINESRNNTTRFAVFSRALNTQRKANKMGEHFILVFTVLNEAGALAKTLNIIGAHNFNMRTLRSRPMKELQWNYYFFVELDGDINSSDGKDMIQELRSVCDRLKIVGTYYSFVER